MPSTTTPRCTIVSFRFGPSDGVSVVARNWADALSGMGFEVDWVAGDVEPDWTDERPLTLVDGLGIDAVFPPDPDALAAALAGPDLAVTETLGTWRLYPSSASASTPSTPVAATPNMQHANEELTPGLGR